MTLGRMILKLFGKRSEEVVGVRRFNHCRYTLVYIFSPRAPHQDNWVWRLDDGTKVGPAYHSYETADWSFGEWMVERKAL